MTVASLYFSVAFLVFIGLVVWCLICLIEFLEQR